MAYVHYISRQHLDVNGVPYDGGRIYYYKAETTDHAEAYVDRECTRLHEWPILLDSRGNCEVYVKENDPIRWELFDTNGEHVETWDCIPLGAEDGDYATREDLEKVVESVDSHVADNKNPHNVTAEQVGAYTKAQVDEIVSRINKEHLDMRVSSDVVEFFTLA